MDEQNKPLKPNMPHVPLAERLAQDFNGVRVIANPTKEGDSKKEPSKKDEA